jgi:hypothetical protein
MSDPTTNNIAVPNFFYIRISILFTGCQLHLKLPPFSWRTESSRLQLRGAPRLRRTGNRHMMWVLVLLRPGREGRTTQWYCPYVTRRE